MKHREVQAAVAKRINDRLKELKMKKCELAEKMGVTRQTVGIWTSKGVNFDVHTLVKLGIVLKMEFFDIVK